MKIAFYGPITTGEVIRKSIADVFLQNQGANQDSDKLLESLHVTPNPTSIIGEPDSDFGFDTAIFSHDDSV